MLHGHLDKFENTMEKYSKEHQGSFHQDIMDFKHRYQSQYNENLMADYNCSLVKVIWFTLKVFCIFL